jgi:hypothetical protein
MVVAVTFFRRGRKEDEQREEDVKDEGEEVLPKAAGWVDDAEYEPIM